jgi:hypothetical protein
MSKTLKPDDFFEKLEKGELSAAPVRLTGMVKKADGSEKAIRFAPGTNCAGWVTIPLDLIEGVEMLRTVPCRDHTHPFVKLTLKEPRSPEGKALFALLGSVQNAPAAMSPKPAGPFPGPGYGGAPAPSGFRPALRPGGGGFGGGTGVIPIESGCHIRCYPASCIDPDTGLHIWCTVCYTECIEVPE